MKLTLEITKKGLRIRKEILNASGFHRETELDIHSTEQAVVILKKEMTAIELVQAVQGLGGLTYQLTNHLANVCGPCEHCKDGCPYTDEDMRIRLPDDAMEQAGFPKGARLDMRIGDHEVVLSEAESYDLRDVPPEVRKTLQQLGICLDELDGLLAGGSVIYAG
nr:hypothetical protein [uncultured Oscillibacter sp.]